MTLAPEALATPVSAFAAVVSLPLSTGDKVGEGVGLSVGVSVGLVVGLVVGEDVFLLFFLSSFFLFNP